MIQIRRGAFETNSSSMHSIAIKKDHGDPILTREWISDGLLRIYFDEDMSFGRYPFRILYSLIDKAKYAIASYLGGYAYPSDDEIEDVLENQIYPIIKKYYPDFDRFEFNRRSCDAYIDPDDNSVYCIRDKEVHHEQISDNKYGYVVYRADGTKSVLKRDPDPQNTVELCDFGDIDHQSMGLLQDFLSHANITLGQFLTDSAYLVIIDGDEYKDFNKYLKAGIIHADDFLEIYSSSSYFMSEINEVKVTSSGDSE
jgi:hypothetical protein